jgi:hypothetical protein
MKKNVEKYSSPEELKKLSQLKSDCELNKQSPSCKQHDDLVLELTRESAIKDAEEHCRNGMKEVCEMLPQIKQMYKNVK